MIGLKTFSILISTLFLLIACVPQTKQTECRANEAFNASLRTCVPIVGGPSSFINVASYSPMFTQTRSKTDTSTLAFTISVSNPYNQSYSVEWERVFNAAPITICSNSHTCSFSAYLLGTVYGQVGTHIVTAKIKDGNGSVVDTQNFELIVSELPKPSINTSTVTPSYPAADLLPSDLPVEFSFTILNNTSISASANYRTEWSVTRNGSLVPGMGEIDYFNPMSLGPASVNYAYLGNATPKFDPATLGVGLYVVRAVVKNDDPGEVVAEQQWSFYIKQPDLANITGIANPAPGVDITAHNNVHYTEFPTHSWIDPGRPDTSVVHDRFCVTVDDRDGTYPTDGKSIQVRWYLDSIGSEICTKKTLDTPGTQTICLVDVNNCEGSGAPFNTSILKFSNSSSSVPQTHKVTARLFDEATTYEFDRADVVPSNGSYPIEWRVNVNPVNTAPVFKFGSVNPAGCTTAGTFARNGCQVTQGSDFTVSFTVTDDFYTPAGAPEQFMWNLSLKRNSSDVTTPDVAMNTSCSKAFNTAVTLPAARTTFAGTEWTCSLNVPNYDSSGPLHPTTPPFQVVLTAQDQGSPVGGAGLPAQALTWNLVVTEANPAAPGIDLRPQTALLADSHISKGDTVLNPADSNSFATELETILFRLNIDDPELDDFKYRISLCKDNTAACTSTDILTSPSYMDFMRAIQIVPSTNPVLVSGLLFTIPEDFLIARHSPSINIDTATSRLVYFKVDVSDIPSVLVTPVRSDSHIFSVYVRNYNPAPVINTATAAPAVGSTSVVYSGFPITIDPGSVTDTGPASERNLQYQWYSKIGAGSWTAIPGASSRIIRYTPGNITSTIDLKLCVGDGTAANPVSDTGTCSGSWFITPKPYSYNLTATGSLSLNNELAVWYDDTNTVPNTQVIYSAYVDSDKNIFVEKTIKNAAGNIVLTTKTLQFSAIPGLASGDVGIVGNLSIAGSANSVYIAYTASLNAAPGIHIPRVRRIDKSFDLVAPARAKSTLAHSAPFGFNYAHFPLACSNLDSCTVAQGDGIGGRASITFATTLTTNDTITVGDETFTAVASPTLENEICDSSCSNTNTAAASLVAKINNHATKLHGITARLTVPGGTIVEIYNQYAFDYIDFDGSIAGVSSLKTTANGLGKIMVTGGRWHLPMIDGFEDDNINVISGAVDFHMRDVNTDLNVGNVLTAMGKTALFDAKINNSGELVFARISAEVGDAGALALFRYSLTPPLWSLVNVAGGSPTDRNNMPIFGTMAFEYVRLATDAASNPYYYVIARERIIDGGAYQIGRYNNQLDSAAAASENALSTRVLTSDATDDVITDTKMKFPELISVRDYPEARIFFHSVGTGTVPFPRLARWKADDSVACGTCFSLSGSLEYQSTSRIGISQRAQGITLGIAGTGTENVNDVVFTLFSSDIANNDVFKPQLGIINVDAEVIQSTAVDGTGRFQPPFVLDQ